MADEEEGTVSSPAASPESHVPDVLIWIKGQPCLVPATCDIATEHPEASLEGPWEYWEEEEKKNCLLYTSPSPRDATLSRMPSSA